MQSVVLRRLPRQVYRITRNTLHYQPARTMSLFPRYINFNQEFSPLFRLLDDYASATSRAGFPASSSIRAFQPKFDVKETSDAYELQGELPGIDQKDISIEWQDSNTITIGGRVEHRSERGQRPAGFVTEGDAGSQKQIEGQEGQEGHEYHKPTVEEEATESSKQSEDKSDDQSTAVTKSSTSQEVAQQSDSDHKYWVTERSVGEFHRSFSFPTRIDQENVKASLKNGVLTITVPKTKAKAPRKINIE